MIRVVHPGSRIRMLTFYPSRIPYPGAEKAPDPGSGSATLMRIHRFSIGFIGIVAACNGISKDLILKVPLVNSPLDSFRFHSVEQA
jgi:hypothetical protein